MVNPYFAKFLGHVGQEDFWIPPVTYHYPLKFMLKANPKKNVVSKTYLSLLTRQNVSNTSLGHRNVVCQETGPEKRH